MTTPESPAVTPDPGGLQAPNEAEVQDKRERKHFEVQVYKDWCKSCGICAALCPKQVLSRDEEGRPLVVAPDACIGCAWCELHCPDFAISVRPRPEKVAAEDEG